MARHDDESDDRDDDRPSRKSSKASAQGSNNTLFIILGVVGGVLLLCCGGSGIAFYIIANRVSNAAQDIARQVEADLKKQQQQNNVKIDDKIEGKIILTKNDKINPTDPQMLVGRMGGAAEMKRAKAFPVQFSKGKTYVINMKQVPGSTLDPYLVLADPKGKTIATDDDGGGYPHARITHITAVDGRFQIIATSFGISTGEFSLTVEER